MGPGADCRGGGGRRHRPRLALYGRDRGPDGDRTFEQRSPRLHRLLENKYYVDEIYDRLIVRPLHFLAKFFWKGIDMLVIDGAINLGAALTEVAGEVGRFSTTGNVRNYALYFFAGVIVLFVWLILCEAERTENANVVIPSVSEGSGRGAVRQTPRARNVFAPPFPQIPRSRSG